MKLPVVVTYRIIDGDPVAIEKEYADIPVNEVARILLKEFKRQQKEKGEPVLIQGGEGDSWKKNVCKNNNR